MNIREWIARQDELEEHTDTRADSSSATVHAQADEQHAEDALDDAVRPDGRSDDPPKRHTTGTAIYSLICRHDSSALRLLQRLTRRFTWTIPPYDPGDQESAISEYLWDTILKKTNGNPGPDVVAPMAEAGTLEVVPYEVKLRFIDDARRASAKKRGGDGEHIPRFDPLTMDGEPATSRDDMDFDPGQERSERPPDGRIEHQTRETWLRMTDSIRRNEMGSDPRLSELGAAERLYRFYLEQPDAENWTDVELGKELGVTDRTIRTYRRALKEFVKRNF